jgi:hypothetical protein
MDIPFSCFFDRDKFLQHIQAIDHWLEFDLDMIMVEKIWSKWFDASMAVWKR